MFWEMPECNTSKYYAYKLEFEAYYMEHTKYVALLKHYRGKISLRPNDLPKYGIGEDIFTFKQQQENYLLVYTQIALDRVPLKAASDFVNRLLNEILEIEMNLSFVSPVNVPPDRKPTEVEEERLFQEYLKNKKKPFLKKVKTILLSKQRLFKSLNVQNLHNEEEGKLIQQPNTRKTPTTEPANIPTETDFDFKNNFDSTGSGLVMSHFKTGLVDKGELSWEDLKLFLKGAFEELLPPKEKYRFKNSRSKKYLKDQFILYWKLAGKPYNERTRYIKLLSNNFEGFNTEQLKNNWKDP